MQGFTYHQDICEDRKMTVDCDVCTVVISWTPNSGWLSSNILNSNNKPIRENLQLLSLPSLEELDLFYIAIKFQNERETFAKNGFETYLKTKEPIKEHFINQISELPSGCCPSKKWTQNANPPCGKYKLTWTRCSCTLFGRSSQAMFL